MFATFRKNIFLVLPTIALGVALLVARHNASEYVSVNFSSPGGKGGSPDAFENFLGAVALALALALLLFLSSRWLVVRLLFYVAASLVICCLLIIGYVYLLASPSEPSANPDSPLDYLAQLSLGSCGALLLLACFRRRP